MSKTGDGSALYNSVT